MADKSKKNKEKKGHKADVSSKKKTSVKHDNGGKVDNKTTEAPVEDTRILRVGSIMAGAIESEDHAATYEAPTPNDDPGVEDEPLVEEAPTLDGSTKSSHLLSFYVGFKNLPSRLFSKNKKGIAENNKSEKKEIKKSKKVSIALAALAALAVVVAGVFISTNIFFKDKIVPNTRFAGMTLSPSPDEAARQIEQKLSEYKISFEYKNDKRVYGPEEVGVNFDLLKTLDNAKVASNKVRFWEKPLTLLTSRDVQPDFAINRQRLRDFLFENQYGDKIPDDAKLEFKDSEATFVVQPESEGRGIDVDDLQSRLAGVVNSLNVDPVDLKVEAIQSDITEEGLQDTLAKLNAYVGQDIIIKTSTKNYQPSPAEIKDWLILSPRQDLGDYQVDINEGAISAYLDGLAGRINVKVQNRVVVPLESGQVTLKAGRNGRSVSNLADSKARLLSKVSSLDNSSGAVIDLIVADEPYTTENLGVTEGRWMFSDLSEFRVYAYEGTNLLRSFSMSAGVSKYPTKTGVYDVWAKVRRQTMNGGSRAQGDYYSVENVEWIAYFNGGQALHGVWWHNEFGVRNRSHGCIGMSNADAQWVYNFVSVGTPVVVVR